MSLIGKLLRLAGASSSRLFWRPGQRRPETCRSVRSDEKAGTLLASDSHAPAIPPSWQGFMRMTSLQRAFIAVAVAGLFLGGCGKRGAESRPPADGYYRLPLTDNPGHARSGAVHGCQFRRGRAAHFQQPREARLETPAGPRPGRELEGLRRRADVHLHAPEGRAVSQWARDGRRRCALLVRAAAARGDRLAEGMGRRADRRSARAAGRKGAVARRDRNAGRIHGGAAAEGGASARR